MPWRSDLLSSDGYAAFVVGFAIMTDSMIYTLVLPFLPEFLTTRLHVPKDQVSQWTALAFEGFAVATLASNAVVGFFADSTGAKSRPFLLSVVIMVVSTILFFVATTPVMLVVSRVVQGASTTFTWVTGLAFLVSQVDESDLGTYVGWTTVGVAVGEFVGPMIGGPIYDHFGHWAAFGVVEGLLILDILLRLFAKEKQKKKPESEAGPLSDQAIEDPAEHQEPEQEALLQPGESSNPPITYDTLESGRKEIHSHRSVAKGLARDWFGTVIALVVIYVVRGALEVAMPLYLTRRYSWSPTKISLTLLTITLPAAANPIIGNLTTRQGPRWWSVGGFVFCGVAMIGFGFVKGQTQASEVLFVTHSGLVGLALAVLINSNQVAISVAAQRYGVAIARARAENEDLGRVMSWLSPSMLLSGVTASWAVGILLGPAYSSLISYTEDAGWSILCWGLGGLCLVSALGSSFLWRKW